MELWVRSQDKMNLVKIRQISLNYRNNKQIIANYMPDSFENSGEYYELLGTYKTKERALEVLDEIQEHIEKQGENYLLSDENGIITGQKYYGYIYQMPID